MSHDGHQRLKQAALQLWLLRAQAKTEAGLQVAKERIARANL